MLIVAVLPSPSQAEAETPPSVVRLGLLAAPGWWLSALRQAVCTRAHWQLHGSQVHAQPATSQTDRPPQVCRQKDRQTNRNII